MLDKIGKVFGKKKFKGTGHRLGSASDEQPQVVCVQRSPLIKAGVLFDVVQAELTRLVCCRKQSLPAFQWPAAQVASKQSLPRSKAGLTLWAALLEKPAISSREA